MLLAVAYGYDYASVRRRMSAKKPGDPFDVVTYPHLLAIPQKGNKVDYELDAQSPLETESCVHSLFPHYGYTPCWYVLRRSKESNPNDDLFPVPGSSSTATLGCVGFAIDDDAWKCGSSEDRTAKSGCATFSANRKVAIRSRPKLLDFLSRAG